MATPPSAYFPNDTTGDHFVIFEELENIRVARKMRLLVQATRLVAISSIPWLTPMATLPMT